MPGYQTSLIANNLNALREQIVGIDQPVPLLDGSRRPYIYLDNAASTPAFRGVQQKVNEFLHWYSSVHRGAGFKSLISTHAYDQARDIVARFVGADLETDCVIFGKNTTEANNILAHWIESIRDRRRLTTTPSAHSWRHRVSRIDRRGASRTRTSTSSRLDRSFRSHP
ncbi:MAG: aminotransferase class V-fold PLP-dependent enzyme [Ardenticatenaceae bacterium]|nr:aminotransferase class V-fold PLP-dependent enzyme [Ardenticatenaceae bacterium]